MFRTSKGNSSGRHAPNIVKARLAKVFVGAYSTYFGKNPPIANEGATVDAFQFLCQAAALPEPSSAIESAVLNFSGVLNKAVRTKIERDDRAKNVSDTIDRLNRLRPSL